MKSFLTVSILTLTAASALQAAENWIDHAIAPVANPLFFESPFIQSEIRPLFMHHNIDDSFATQGGDIRVYAMQARYAVTERLAIIATKDGVIELNPKAAVPKADGWANIAAGLKYAVIDDRERQFILTPGVKIDLPTGNTDVLQGQGDGEWDLFVSSAKGWGDFHLTGNAGARIPMDLDEGTTQLHYSLQADYYTCQWFIPFITTSAFTILDEGKGPAFGVEGWDLVNFGTSNARGETQVVVGGGFRSRLCRWADLGFAYEAGVSKPKGLFDDRVTVDLAIRF